MNEINLIGGFYKSKSLPFSAQDVVNWLPVPSKSEAARSPIKLRGLPGLKPLTPSIAPAENYQRSLLHFDYFAQPTNFVDEFAWTWERNPFSPPAVQSSISTAQKKFGSSSLFCPGKPGGVSTWYHGIVITTTTMHFLGNVNDIANDICMDAWVYISGGSGEMAVFGNYFAGSPSDFLVSVEPSGFVRFRNLANPIESALIAGGTCPVGSWFHVALSRTGGVARLFLNGALIGSAAYTATTDNGGRFIIGNSGNNSIPMNGYIDEVHLTWGDAGSGAARYIAAFTPPTSPYTPP